MRIDKKQIKKILLITLTNIGDIILTTPVVAALDREFPEARIDVMAGPHGEDIFSGHPRIFRVIVYDKHIPFQEKRRFVRELKQVNYDLIVDLKNTLFPMLIGSKYRTSPIQVTPKRVVHKKDFHLWKLRSFGIDVEDVPFSVYVGKKDRDHINILLADMLDKDKIVVISPTAKSLIKRWSKKGFAEAGDRIVEELGATLIMVGDDSDREFIDGIINSMNSKALNLAGLTSIPQLAHLLKLSRLLITNDSAPMHIGAAMGTDVLAIFGPTDPRKYGPRGSNDRILRKDLNCSPCEVAQCKYKHECMQSISAEEVYRAAKDLLTNRSYV